jgi:hypothetical protein
VAKPDDTHAVGLAKNSRFDTAATNGVKTSLVPVDVGGVEQEDGADAAVILVGRTKREVDIDTLVNSVVAVVEEASPALGALENFQPALASTPADEHPNHSDS